MSDIFLLAIATVKIAFLHTLLGPDHYLPFIMMATARKWSMLKTSWVTLLCGLGHVLGSILLGLVGVTIGIGISRLIGIESLRGELASWLLTSFGLVYFVWGMGWAIKNKPHTHFHAHADGTVHQHEHTHHQDHSHVHDQTNPTSVTPWVLFIIFVMGPCEPLIPILMYPAARESLGGMILVSSLFGIVTMVTMLGMVLISTFGISFLPLAKLHRYTHAIAGATIGLYGLAILALGL